MKNKQILFTLYIFFATICLISCTEKSSDNENSKDNVIFGVYQADWMALRYYLYHDSTFYKVEGETEISNSFFDGPSAITTYSLVEPVGFGTYTVFQEGENRILKFNYKQFHGSAWNLSSRHKIESDQSFFSINEVHVKETFNKVGGVSALLPK